VVFARWRQCALTCGHIGATWWIRLKLCTLVSPGDYDWTRAIFGPPKSTTLQSDHFSHFCTAYGRMSLYFTVGDPFSQNCFFSSGWSGCHLTHDSLGHSETTIQTSSRSVQPFLHRWPQSVPILWNGPPPSPKIAPLHGVNLYTGDAVWKVNFQSKYPWAVSVTLKAWLKLKR